MLGSGHSDRVAATFSSAVIHAALRLQRAAPASIFCYTSLAPGRLEVYGESEAKPCYSAGFALSSERALAVARAELRLSPEHPAIELSDALAAPSAPIAYAAALAASAPLLGNFANLLPAERRASHSRTRYLIPIALASLVVLGIIAVFVIFPIVNERRYVADLTAEQRRIRASRPARAKTSIKCSPRTVHASPRSTIFGNVLRPISMFSMNWSGSCPNRSGPVPSRFSPITW